MTFQRFYPKWAGLINSRGLGRGYSLGSVYGRAIRNELNFVVWQQAHHTLQVQCSQPIQEAQLYTLFFQEASCIYGSDLRTKSRSRRPAMRIPAIAQLLLCFVVGKETRTVAH